MRQIPTFIMIIANENQDLYSVLILHFRLTIDEVQHNFSFRRGIRTPFAPYNTCT